MARTKQFDPDVAVDAAMKLFWEQGYEATAMADLLVAMGINRASFYDTFGSKHDLYVRALDRYMAGAPGPAPLELLSRPGRAIEAVRGLVDAYAQGAVPGLPRGCMVVNALVDTAVDDAVVAGRLQAYERGTEAALTTTLLRARAEGDLPVDADASALARFLLAVLKGLQVLRRSGADPAVVRDAAAVAVRALA